ncbi:27437_t:CDS:2, partial [Gigaspora margarita]
PLDYDIFVPIDEEYPYDFDINASDYLNDLDYLGENFLMSGNPKIDKFIRNDGKLKWIPYGQLTNIEYLACGGFGVVSKAKWKSRKVVLKSLNNSKDVTTDILREIAYHQQFDHHNYVIYVVQCYGISRDPATGNCLMVMHYFEGGNLRQYLDSNYEICNGLRPNLDVVSVPQLLKALIIKCWDDNPTLRPEAEEILFHFREWYLDSNTEFRLQYQQIKVAEESLTSNNLIYQTHPQAIYTSRLLDLNSKENDFYVPENLGELNINNNDRAVNTLGA